MTGLQKFDNHLKNEDFFNVEKFSEAKFVSKRVEPVNEKQARVHGELTLLGVTKPLTLNVTLNKMGVNPYNKKETVGFTAEGVIKRSQYGMSYGIPGIPDDVELLIETEAMLAQ